MRTVNANLTETTLWPRRPLEEIDRSIKAIKAAGLFAVAIALFDNHDQCLYEYRRWLEGHWALGCNLVIKKRASQQYAKLWDAILIPCSGPVIMDLSQDGGGFRLLSRG